MRSIKRRASVRAWVPGLIACAGLLAVAIPATAHAQDRSRDRNDRNGSSRDNGRDSSRDSDKKGATSRDDARRHRDDNHVRFTHSAEGRRFDNGVTLRRSVVHTDRRLDAYFPHHTVSYPHYVTTRVVGSVVISPFSFYAGVFPPYIERSHVIFSRPSRVFIDVVIDGGRRDDYYLSRRGDDTRWRNDTDLKHSVYDLEDAFKNEDIELLAPLTDPGTKIAIFARGHYEYSLDANDYLDMTRDFMRSVHTTDFDAYRVHYKTNGVYQIFARHSFKDQDGQSKVVNLCIVVERIGDRWTITQIDSSPQN